MLKSMSVFLACILITALAWEIFFPEWRFASRDLRVSAVVAMPFVFVALIGCLLALKFKSWQVAVPACLFLVQIAGCFSWSSLHPLDTHSEPFDTGTPIEMGNNRRKITRMAYNNRHNYWESNSAVVEERFIFRKVVTQTDWKKQLCAGQLPISEKLNSKDDSRAIY